MALDAITAFVKGHRGRQLLRLPHDASFPGQVATLTFTVPHYDRAKVYGHDH